MIPTMTIRLVETPVTAWTVTGEGGTGSSRIVASARSVNTAAATPCTQMGQISADALDLIIFQNRDSGLGSAILSGLLRGAAKELIPRLGSPACVIAAGGLTTLALFSPRR